MRDLCSDGSVTSSLRTECEPQPYICERLRLCNLERALLMRCLTWYRHIQRSDSWISKITDFEVAGKKIKGRPSKTWGIV